MVPLGETVVAGRRYEPNQRDQVTGKTNAVCTQCGARQWHAPRTGVYVCRKGSAAVCNAGGHDVPKWWHRYRIGAVMQRHGNKI